MKTVILYKSEHGATKQYADWLKEELPHADLWDIDEFDRNQLTDYDTIIIGSCVYRGQMPALPFLTSNWQSMKDKRVFYFTVGLIPPNSMFSKEMYETIPQEIRESITYAKLPGQVSTSKPTFLQKLAFKLFMQGDADSKVDRSKLEPILEFAKEP